MAMWRAFLIAVSCLGAASHAAAQTGIITNGFDRESAPFAYLDETDTPTGFDIEVLNRIAEIEGLQISHSSIVFDQLIDTLKGAYASDGETIDIIDSGFTITPERQVEVAFTIPYLSVQKVLLVSAGSSATSTELLGAGHIIAVRDGSIEAAFLEQNSQATLYYYDGFDEALDDLSDGVVSAIAMDELTANRAVAADGFQITGSFGMPPAQVAFAVRKNDFALLNALNDGLAQLWRAPSGTL